MTDGTRETKASAPLAHLKESELIGLELDRCTAFLPPIPEILLKLERELDSEWLNVSRLSNLIRTDPALVGAVLKVSNSPLWRGTKQITEVEEAFQRIGKDNLRSVAMLLALRQGKLPSAGLHGSSMQDFWRHALLVAAGAVQLVRTQTTQRDILDQVWTASLLHDIGALLLPLLYPQKWPALEERVSALDTLDVPVSLLELEREILGGDHARVSGVFAERGWKLPAPVVVLGSRWTTPQEVDPPFAAWAIHRADLAAQTLGICWQPQATRALSLDDLDADSGAGPACDPAFCLASVEKHIPLVDALLSN